MKVIGKFGGIFKEIQDKYILFWLSYQDTETKKNCRVLFCGNSDFIETDIHDLEKRQKIEISFFIKYTAYGHSLYATEIKIIEEDSNICSEIDRVKAEFKLKKKDNNNGFQQQKKLLTLRQQMMLRRLERENNLPMDYYLEKYNNDYDVKNYTQFKRRYLINN